MTQTRYLQTGKAKQGKQQPGYSSYFNSLSSVLLLGHKTQTLFQKTKVLFLSFSFILQVEVANVSAMHVLYPVRYVFSSP